MNITKQCIAKIEIGNDILWNYLNIEMNGDELSDPLSEGYYIQSHSLLYYLTSFEEYMYIRFNNDQDTLNDLQDTLDILLYFIKDNINRMIFISK